MVSPLEMLKLSKGCGSKLFTDFMSMRIESYCAHPLEDTIEILSDIQIISDLLW